MWNVLVVGLGRTIRSPSVFHQLRHPLLAHYSNNRSANTKSIYPSLVRSLSPIKTQQALLCVSEPLEALNGQGSALSLSRDNLSPLAEARLDERFSEAQRPCSMIERRAAFQSYSMSCLQARLCSRGTMRKLILWCPAAHPLQT